MYHTCKRLGKNCRLNTSSLLSQTFSRSYMHFSLRYMAAVLLCLHYTAHETVWSPIVGEVHVWHAHQLLASRFEYLLGNDRLVSNIIQRALKRAPQGPMVHV